MPNPHSRSSTASPVSMMPAMQNAAIDQRWHWLVARPCTTCTKFMRKIDMPMAEISGARRNDPRSGRYAMRSMAQFHSAVSSMPSEQHEQRAPTPAAPAEATLRQQQEEDERDEGRQHENIAVREVDHADDAEHHRVADGDETVDRSKRDAVDQLLDEIFHESAPRPVA